MTVDVGDFDRIFVPTGGGDAFVNGYCSLLGLPLIIVIDSLFSYYRYVFAGGATYVPTFPILM